MAAELDSRRDDDGSSDEDRWSKPITALLVAATLAAAFVGYLLTAASRSSDATGVRAERLGSQSMTELLETQQKAQVSYETFIKAEEQRGRAASVLQSSLLVGDAKGRDLKLTAARWNHLAAQTQLGTSLTVDGPDGPRQDSLFPRRFFANATRDALRFSALQDAANQENSQWEQHTAPYTAILTLFAVSLYLLGFALTMSAAVRRLFATVGVSLLAVGLVWMLVVWTSPVGRDSPAASTEFALGRIAMQTATTQQEFGAAVEHFSRAIELRPTFARAYVERGYARFSAGSSQSLGYPSFTKPEALEGAVADFSEGVRLGVGDFWILWNLGSDEYLLSLVQHQRGDPQSSATLERAIEHTREAISLDPGNPAMHYNLGLQLLAAGRVEDARYAYQDAIDRTLDVDDAAREEGWVAGAITDLQYLADTRPEWRDEIQDLKAFVAGTVSRDADPPAHVDPFEVRPDVFANGVQLNFAESVPCDEKQDWRCFGPSLEWIGDAEPVSVQWYYQDPDAPGWGVIPEISTIRTTPAGAGDFRSLLAVQHQCLRDGEYRAEIYVGDLMVTTPTTTVSWGDPTPLLAPDLNVELCAPNAWARPRELRTLRGVVDGAAGEDRGVYILRVNLPPSLTKHPSVGATLNFTRDAIERFRNLFHGLERIGTGGSYGTPSFMSETLRGRVSDFYDYEGVSGKERIEVVAGVGPDGGLIVGALFGPENFVRWMVYHPWIFDSADSFDDLGLHRPKSKAASGGGPQVIFYPRPSPDSGT